MQNVVSNLLLGALTMKDNSVSIVRLAMILLVIVILTGADAPFVPQIPESNIIGTIINAITIACVMAALTFILEASVISIDEKEFNKLRRISRDPIKTYETINGKFSRIVGI